jgi:hypothetical protein
MAKQARPPLVVMNASPVLITESAEKFSRLHDALKDEFKPRGTIEAIKVKEMAVLIWETHRYRRAKTAIINAAFALL